MFHDHVLRDLKLKKNLFSFQKWIWGVQYKKNQTMLFVDVDFEKPFNYLVVDKNGKTKITENFQINIDDYNLLDIECNYGKFRIDISDKNHISSYPQNKFLNRLTSRLSSKYHCYGFKNKEINYVESLIWK